MLLPTQCDYHKAKSQSVYKTGNYCSNNHLLVPMHIYTHLYHITVYVWNLLPEAVVNLPLQHFKSNIVNYTS